MPKQNHTPLYEIFRLSGLGQPGAAPAPLGAYEPFLGRGAALHTVPAGTELNRPEPRYNIQLVLRGEFCVWRTNAKGIPNLIAVNAAPELVGVAQVMLAQVEAPARLEARTECTYVQIDPDYFLRCMEQDGGLATIVARNLLEKQQRALRRADGLICNTTQDNLLLYFYNEWRRQGMPTQAKNARQPAFSLPMDHGQMAARLGVCVRTLGRAMKAVKEQGWVTVQGRTLAFSAGQLARLQAHCNRLHTQLQDIF